MCVSLISDGPHRPVERESAVVMVTEEDERRKILDPLSPGTATPRMHGPPLSLTHARTHAHTHTHTQRRTRAHTHTHKLTEPKKCMEELYL